MDEAVTRRLNAFLLDEEIERELTRMNNADSKDQSEIFWQRAQVLLDKRKQRE